nr:hypothetical protein [Tanacetum cinerariifolium]
IAGLKFRYLSVPSSLSAVALFFRDVSLYCITDIRSVLTQRALNFVCEMFRISNEIYPQLASPNQTIHEMPAGKIEHYATLVAYPAPFHKIGERGRDEDEPKLLETTVGRVVSLLPVAHDRSSSELEASVDKLFYEGGSGEQADQGDSVSGGHGVGVQPVNVIVEAVVEDVAPAELQRKKKRKTKVDVGEPSHPAKKLRGDYGVSGEPTVGGKSQSAGMDHAEFLAGANLRTLEAPQRFVISSNSSDHSGANIAEAEVDSIVRTSVPIMTSATTATPTADPAATANERLIGSSVFYGDFSFAGGIHPISGGFSDRIGSDFLVGGIRTVVDHDSNLQRVYVSQWNVTNGFCMDDEGVCHEMVDVRMRVEYNIKEKKRLKSVVEEKDVLLKSRCDEIESLKAQLVVKEPEAAEAVHLAASVKVREQEIADLDVVVTSVKLQNDSLVDQDEKIKEVNEKFDKPCVDFVDTALHLEKKFYSHLLTTIFRRRAMIGKAIEKGMQEGLSVGITHGAGGRTLTDVAAYNPSMEADYLSALQRDALAEKLGFVESQPHVDQPMVSIHHYPDQRVVGASALSLSLDVSSSRVRKIKENIANHVSTLRGVFVPLSEPLSAMALEGAKGTSGATPDTTTALSVTSISTSTIPPIYTDDYEIAHTDGGEGAVTDVEAVVDEGEDPFLDVSGAELDVLK